MNLFASLSAPKMYLPVAAALVAALGLGGCATSRFTATSEADHAANLRQYESYVIIDSLQATGGQANPQLTNDFYRARFVQAVQGQMRGRGYVETTNPASADLRATLFLTSRSRTQSNYMPGGFGSFGMGWGGGFGNNYASSYEEATLGLNLRDARTGRLLWQGLVSGAQQDYTRRPDKAVPEAVSRLFSQWPTAKGSRRYDPVEGGARRNRTVSTK